MIEEFFSLWISENEVKQFINLNLDSLNKQDDNELLSSAWKTGSYD